MPAIVLRRQGSILHRPERRKPAAGRRGRDRRASAVPRGSRGRSGQPRSGSLVDFGDGRRRPAGLGHSVAISSRRGSWPQGLGHALDRRINHGGKAAPNSAGQTPAFASSAGPNGAGIEPSPESSAAASAPAPACARSGRISAPGHHPAGEESWRDWYRGFTGDGQGQKQKSCPAHLRWRMGRARRQLASKTVQYGSKRTVRAGFYAGSRLCSACRWENQLLWLSDRKWTCLNCGCVHDRDHNAAIPMLPVPQAMREFPPLKIAALASGKTGRETAVVARGTLPCAHTRAQER